MKKILLIVVMVVVLAGGGGAFFLISSSGKTKKPKAPEVHHETVQLEEFIANLADNTARHYIKLSLAIEVESSGEGGGGHGGGAAEEAIKEANPYIRDGVLAILSKQHYVTLLTEEGKANLKAELKEAIQQALEKHDIKVSDILFTDIVLD